MAHRELTDDERIKEDMLALQMELEIGTIDEDEYLRREAGLVERLREAREWRVRLGMEEEWAPYGFSGSSSSGGAEISGPDPELRPPPLDGPEEDPKEDPGEPG